MRTFSVERLDVRGIEVSVWCAGNASAPPLVFFHGGTALGGFDWLLPLAECFHLLVPVRPGWGDSTDDPSVTGMQDYVLHELDLFDLLGLERVRLVGHSLGGWLAALFAAQQDRRVERLALVSPAGLKVPEAPSWDPFRLKPEEIPAYLTVDPEGLGLVGPPPDVERIVARYREQISSARLTWERNYDPTLARWLHRLRRPTLLVWGSQDRVSPAGQARAWADLVPGARVEILPGRGHLVLEEGPEAVALIAEFMA